LGRLAGGGRFSGGVSLLIRNFEAPWRPDVRSVTAYSVRSSGSAEFGCLRARRVAQRHLKPGREIYGVFRRFRGVSKNEVKSYFQTFCRTIKCRRLELPSEASDGELSFLKYNLKTILHVCFMSKNITVIA
jgi:hypothetical protein